MFLGSGDCTLTNLMVRGTTKGACALLPSTDAGYCLKSGETAASRGIALLGPSKVTLQSFDLVNNGTMGAQLLLGTGQDGTAFGTTGTLTLTDGTVTSQDVGVNLQDVTGYDESSLQNNVSYAGATTPIAHDTKTSPQYIVTPTK